ncbi:MAG: hypothetical protein R1F54_00470 [Candidatus Zeuxoniibacter abyssi]|nr:MAG: hypothetical protein R1F54_00470 [Candidatus Persebacteraceae bacterium AB1(2)]
MVAISHEAVVTYEKNRYEKVTHKLQRHHPIAFARTADEMLSDKKNLTFSEWFSLIKETEEVHLITKEEHKSLNYTQYPIPSHLKLFKNQYIGWKYGEKKNF